MINPEDQIPFDDQEFADKDEQEQASQTDIHSNGLEEERTPRENNNDANPDALKQAYLAAESSFTLDDGSTSGQPAKETKEE